MRVTRAIVLAAVLAFGAGCTAHLAGDGLREADRRFAAADYAGAAAAYRNALSDGAAPADLDRALFRLALIHALPESPLHDPERAEALLGNLAAEHPASPYGQAAGLLLANQRRRRDLSAELAVESARADALAARLEIAASASAENATERAAERETAEAGERERTELRRRTTALETELATCRETVTRLEDELARLKAIDLDEP